MNKIIRDQVKDRIVSAVSEVLPDFASEKIELEHPELLMHGDFSTNVALVAKGGRGMAEKLANLINEDDLIAKLEVAGPGFLNIWLQNDALVKELDRVLIDRDDYGKNLSLRDSRVMIEFTDPNPFKEFHIGHLYSNIVGESLSRLLEYSGAEVWRVTYQGDVGLHVAKSIWGMQKLAGEMPDESSPLGDKMKFLGRAYALGATSYESAPELRTEIENINRLIYQGDPVYDKLYKLGKAWSLTYFDSVYERLGSKFVRNYFESQSGQVGLEYVKKHLQSGVFEESEGAIVFRGENYGLHTRVFVNSQGLPTYEAKELGLAPTKYSDFKYDLSFVVTGNEIEAYFKVLLKALSLIEPELAKKTHHITHGMVKLPTGKMSSRTGKVITGEWLLDVAAQTAAKKMKEGMAERESCEVVGQAAVKYALLKSGLGGDVEFDFEQSVDFQGDSGPYLQYTFARIQSVIRGYVLNSEKTKSVASDISELGPEDELLRHIYRFPEVVLVSRERLSPNLICGYLYGLAQRYNSFYNQQSIRSADSEARIDLRVRLSCAVGHIIKNGLWLIGAKTLERM